MTQGKQGVLSKAFSYWKGHIESWQHELKLKEHSPIVRDDMINLQKSQYFIL
ncbi:MAG: hypothetical protein HQK97_05580 [Nitrospirae bacterium]|nr:hypothetical protein [Nitrospirota bacterium]